MTKENKVIQIATGSRHDGIPIVICLHEDGRVMAHHIYSNTVDSRTIVKPTNPEKDE